jgi:hypothetical protein
VCVSARAKAQTTAAIGLYKTEVVHQHGPLKGLAEVEYVIVDQPTSRRWTLRRGSRAPDRVGDLLEDL